MIRYSIIVDGKVQGVGFRYFTQMKAMQFNLTGFCKNLYDGKVSIEVQGLEQDVLSFIAAIKKGNGFCRVDDLVLDKLSIIDNEKNKYLILSKKGVEVFNIHKEQQEHIEKAIFSVLRSYSEEDLKMVMKLMDDVEQVWRELPW